MGNISAVLAFNIEKDKDAIRKELYKILDHEGNEISESSRRVFEEARTKSGISIDYSNNIGKRGVGKENAGVGGRNRTDRGANNALDSGAHVVTDSGERFRDKEEIEPVFYSKAMKTLMVSSRRKQRLSNG